MKLRRAQYQLIPWVILTTIVSLTLLALSVRFWDLRDITRDMANIDVSQSLDRQLTVWKTTQQQSTTRTANVLIRQHYDTQSPPLHSLFPAVEDTLYWTRNNDGTTSIDAATTPPRTLNSLTDPCLETARTAAFNRQMPISERVNQYIDGCRFGTTTVRLAALKAAITLLKNADEPNEAIALYSQHLPPLSDDISLDVLEQHYSLATLMIVQNHPDGPSHLLQTTTYIGQRTDATALTRRIRTSAMAMLKTANLTSEADTLTQLFDRHQRRHSATTSLPRIIKQMTNSTFVCATTQCDVTIFVHENEQGGVALIMDTTVLARDLLNRLSQYHNSSAILDGSGVSILGAKSSQPISMKQSLAPILPGKSIGIRASAIKKHTSHVDDQLLILLVFGLSCLLLAFLGISAQYRANKRLQRLLERQSDFTRRSAHELRTPLSVISLLAENLMEGLYKSDAVPHVAGQIVEETDRLVGRVDELLQLSRPNLPIKRLIFDPEDAALSALGRWAPRYAHANITLFADIQETQPIFGNEIAVRDAISALLDNAYKYINPAADTPSVWLTIHQNGGSVVIIVKDNGLGVPTPLRRDIFEAFVRIEGDHRGTAGGYGLGLSHVKTTAISHHGTVKCGDGVDGGTAITLTLPSHSIKTD